MASSRGQRLVFAAIMMVTVALGARGITDEASVMLGGDMARYVMNGVFLHDLIGAGGAWSTNDLVAFAERYYARYPALSLGHHPPLPFVALLPFFAVFGVSLFAARLAALAFFVAAAWGLYRLTDRLFGWQAASWAALLFVTNLYVLRAGQYLLSEMPMLALTLAAVNALLTYCDSGRTKHFVWFVLCAVASLYAKQLAVFMLPVYGLILVTRLGWPSLFRRHVIVLAVVGAALAAPLAAMTYALAPANVRLAEFSVTRLGTSGRFPAIHTMIGRILTTHLSWPMLVAVAAGVLSATLRRDRRVIVSLVWLVSVVGGTVLFAGFEPARYAFLVMPAYFLMAADLALPSPWRAARWTNVLLLAAALAWQGWQIRNVHPSGAGGYEAAAEFITAQGKGAAPAILFDSGTDTGYFVFFMRKHDPAGHFLVLRADKLLTTPATDGSSAPRVVDQGDIYATLNKFGVEFIVVEERTRGPKALRLLQDELKSDRFIERQRIPIVTSDPLAMGKNLLIYQFKDAGPADPEAELDIDLPRGGRQIRLRLQDLVGAGR